MLNNCALPLDVMVKNYNTSLSITLDNHAPIVCKIITVRKMHFGMTNTLLSAKRPRRKLERKWRETKSSSDYREYGNQSIALNKNLETAKGGLDLPPHRPYVRWAPGSTMHFL